METVDIEEWIDKKEEGNVENRGKEAKGDGEVGKRVKKEEINKIH